MTASAIRYLFVLGLVLVMAAPPILAEGVENVKAEETALGAGGAQPHPMGITDHPGERGDSANAELFDETELESFGSRAEEPGEEVAGGALTNEQLTYIVIALAAAVIVLILV